MTVTIGKLVSEIVLGIMELEDGSHIPYVYSQTEAIKQLLGHQDIIKVCNVNGINMVCDIDENVPVTLLPTRVALKSAVVFSEEPQKLINMITDRKYFTEREIRAACNHANSPQVPKEE